MARNGGMLRLMRSILIPCLLCTVVSCAISCGDDDGMQPPEGMQPLVADPAVVIGCAPGAFTEPGSRAKVVACGEELMTGLLAAGRPGDLVIENERVKFIIRGPGEGLLFHGTTGGGVV